MVRSCAQLTTHMTLNMAESSFLPLSPKHLITGIQYLQNANIIILHFQQEIFFTFNDQEK
jgi:hypothetical protein